MRIRGLLCVLIGLAFATGVEISRADPGKDATSERAASLIRQLGHDEFATREAASKELEAIGEPALNALRKAAAADGDTEIRRRAEQVIRAISRTVGKKELAKWEGSWKGDEGVTMTIKGDRFTSRTPSTGPRNGTITVIEVGEKVAHVDLLIDEGDTRGQTFKAIFRLDGDTLHSCGTYNEARPTEFKSEGANYYIPWKRAKK